jgi:hypothetical protein
MHKVYTRAFANAIEMQISGFLAMPDFLNRFGENGVFTPVREGTIVGLLSIGTLLGAIIAAPIADKFGRRMCILDWYDCADVSDTSLVPGSDRSLGRRTRCRRALCFDPYVHECKLVQHPLTHRQYTDFPDRKPLRRTFVVAWYPVINSSSLSAYCSQT